LFNFSRKIPATKTEKETSYRFPISYVKGILNAIGPITLLLSSNFKEKFVTEFKAAFFERIEKLTIRDIKDNDPGQVLGLVRDSLYIFEDFYGKEAYSLCEQAELECALLLLKSPFLEKKIRAIAEFKDFFERADPHVDIRYF
jgi:hypothetical protein